MQCTQGMKFSAPPTLQPTTPKPTAPMPTYSPLPDGKKRLMVVVTLDAFPEDTGWSLGTLDGSDVIFEIPIGTYDRKDKFQTHEYMFEVDGEMFYQLKIKDYFADGFGGTIDVYEGALVSAQTRIVHEPGFTEVSGKEVSHSFYAGDQIENQFTLAFDFDPFPEEVAYEVKDSKGNILALQWFDSFQKGTQSAIIEIPIYSTTTGTQAYNITLWDSGSDGLCCGGGYKLYLGTLEENDLLKSGGDYGKGEAIEVTIEGFAPSMSPTSFPSASPSGQPTNFPTTSILPTITIKPTPSSFSVAQSNESDESNMEESSSSNSNLNSRRLSHLVYFFGSSLLLLI